MVALPLVLMFRIALIVVIAANSTFNLFHFISFFTLPFSYLQCVSDFIPTHVRG